MIIKMTDESYKKKNFIIAIDGGVWVGKSTIAKALAKLLGYNYINTGSIFRAIAYKVIKNGISLNDNNKIIEIAKNTKIEFKGEKILMDNKDINNEIKNQEIVPIASKISSIPELRDIILKIERDVGKGGGVIFEGRDIGTEVFPNADWKFYVCASMDIRIERWIKSAKKEEIEKYSREDIKKIIEELDEREINRKVAPLKIADDAIIYDNSDSPSSEEDAAVLKNYITNWEEIRKNAELLNKKIR